jgi:hypothetical protein
MLTQRASSLVNSTLKQAVGGVAHLSGLTDKLLK